MAEDANLTAALITAGFSFAAAIGGVLWTERSKRRDAERKHAHEANALRRVLASDLGIAIAICAGNIKIIKDHKDLEYVAFACPNLRPYSIEKIGLLSVDEIDAVVAAIAAVQNQREVIEALMAHKLGELFVLARDDAAIVLDSFVSSADICRSAITELKSETGPIS